MPLIRKKALFAVGYDQGFRPLLDSIYQEWDRKRYLPSRGGTVIPSSSVQDAVAPNPDVTFAHSGPQTGAASSFQSSYRRGIRPLLLMLM